MKKIILLLAVFAFLAGGCSLSLSQAKKPVVITPEEAKTKAVDFINNNLMQAGSQVTAKSVTVENGLYKVAVVLSNGQEVDSYLTQDGTKFFPQAMDIVQYEAQANAAAPTPAATPATPTDIPKLDKVTVELFVMSHCPYGTQIEKGILPVLDKIGKKINFSLKFVSYAMHGEKEVREELNQYCIEKNEPAKLAAYLQCFLADETKSAACVTQTGINKGNLDKCTAATDKQYKVMASFADKSTWANGTYPPVDMHKADNTKYGVSGSPSLVINGKLVSAGRDPQSLLNAVCAGFTTPPAECKDALSTATPSAGFGFSTANASDSAANACGN